MTAPTPEALARARGELTKACERPLVTGFASISVEDASTILAALDAADERLRSYNEEVAQFNAGVQRAEKHEGPWPLDPREYDVPASVRMERGEHDHDSFGSGFAWGAYERMAKALDAAGQAVAAEREACAKLCDGWCAAHEEVWELGPGHSPCCHAKDCAAAIRSRGKEAGDE